MRFIKRKEKIIISNIKTIFLNGIDGNLIEIQIDIVGGLPNFQIVGLPDTNNVISKLKNWLVYFSQFLKF